jgi:hypothetical protein
MVVNVQQKKKVRLQVASSFSCSPRFILSKKVSLAKTVIHRFLLFLHSSRSQTKHAC